MGQGGARDGGGRPRRRRDSQGRHIGGGRQARGPRLQRRGGGLRRGGRLDRGALGQLAPLQRHGDGVLVIGEVKESLRGGPGQDSQQGGVQQHRARQHDAVSNPVPAGRRQVQGDAQTGGARHSFHPECRNRGRISTRGGTDMGCAGQEARAPRFDPRRKSVCRKRRAPPQAGPLSVRKPTQKPRLTAKAFASRFRALFEADPVRPDERPSFIRRIARRYADRVPASFVFIRSPSGAAKPEVKRQGP